MSEQLNESVFDNIIDPFARRRKDMLPGWIKAFCWIFMVATFLVPPMLLLDGMQGGTSLSIYGLRATHAFSVGGAVIVMLFILKGATGLGLITEKDWAVKLGLADALIGIVLCIVTMFTGDFITSYSTPTESGFHMRVEIFLIIPYLYKLWRIKDEWEANAFVRQQKV
jgi:hypothetical protein